MTNIFKMFIVVNFVLVFAVSAEAQFGAGNGNGGGQAGTIQNDGQIEGVTQSTGFIGGSDTGNPRSQSSVGGGFGNNMSFSMGGMGGMGGFGSFGGFGNQNQNQNQTQNTLRFPYVVAFRTSPFVPMQVQVRAETRLKRLPGLSKFNQVSVTMNKTTATLKGIVVSDRDKRFVEKLVLLEPGVKEIDNQLAVKATE